MRCVALRIRKAGGQQSVVRLRVALQSCCRVARSLAAIRVHDGLCCDVRRLKLSRRGLVAADIGSNLQVLPLLAA